MLEQAKERLDWVHETCKKHGLTDPVKSHLQPDQAAIWGCIVRLNNVCAELLRDNNQLRVENEQLARQLEAVTGIRD